MTTDHIDRFRILRKLGQGGQGVVYLAEDPRLERLVAIKTIDRLLSQEQGVRLMDEARMISKMRHPNVVSVYEAGDVGGKPYVVFEYVEGVSLSDLIRKEGVMVIHNAVSMMIQVLDGMAYAHQMGIIHRDLNPSNIMIDRNSVARIMDFGLSMMIGAMHEAAGTPYYMSPEHFSQEPLTPKADIFSLGLVFYEMLTGRPAFTGDDRFALMYRISHDPAEPPSLHNKAIDPDLDRAILKALEKKPADRYEDASELKRWLESYKKPEERSGRDGNAQDAHGTVEFLMRRMRLKGDIPAFSHHVVEINAKLSSLAAISLSSAGELANIILKDVSLTNKLLRVVNSAHYGNLAGRVTTISKAVLLLGFEKLRMIASALMIFEHLQDKVQAAELKEAALGCFMSGSIALEAAEKIHLGRMENVFICGMLYNLGRLLVICYFPEEHEEIKNRMIQKGIDEGKAARAVIGISYNQLGMAVSRSWNFPDMIIQSMQGLPPGAVETPKTDGDMLRSLSCYANELCDVIVNTTDRDRTQALTELSTRYQKSVPLPVKEMVTLLEAAAMKIDHYSEIVNVDRGKSIFIKKLTQYRQSGIPDAADSADEGLKSQRITGETQGPSPDMSVLTMVQDDRHILTNGIQEIAEVLKGKFDLGDVIYMILELMYRGFAFNRVLFCLRDAARSRMVARFGLGDRSEAIVKIFQIQMGLSSDLFHLAVSQPKGITIDDADVPSIARNLPEWYRAAIAAPAFLVYPIMVKGACIGLFYADKTRKGPLLTAEQREYMDDLRSMAVEAMTKRPGND